jgi:hypothetical protein
MRQEPRSGKDTRQMKRMLLFLCLAIAAGLWPSRWSRAEELKDETGASLYDEARAICPATTRFGPPFTLPADLTARVKVFREKVVRFTQTRSPEELNLYWSNAARDSFMLSCMTEWTELEKAEAGLREWWKVLDGIEASQSNMAADLSMHMARICIHSWAWERPEDALRLLEETHARLFDRLSTEEQGVWKWWAARFAEMFQRAIKRVPAERRAAFLARTYTLFDNQTGDESLPLDDRTHTLATRARILHTAGQPAAATALLEAWYAKYGEQITSSSFYTTWFFVACLEQGDRQRMRQLVQRATALAANGVVSTKDSNYDSMIRLYYRRMFLSATEMKRRAGLFVAALRSDKPHTATIDLK